MKRYKYNKTPLIEVIFQLRFPTILKINSQEPVQFQDRIRETYPLYKVSTEQTTQVLPNGKEQIINQNKNYQFTTADGKSKINLTSSFIAFSTLSYDQWETFVEQVGKIELIFREIYTPAFYSRIGLRYKDLILRSNWDLQTTPWSELLQSHVLGVLKDNEAKTMNYSVKTETRDEQSLISTKKNFDLVIVEQTQEKALLIDCDYFVNNPTSCDTYLERSETLHNESANFISTAITEKLSKAMEPIEIGQ